MSTDALKEALQRIASAATDALAALPGDDEPGEAVAVIEPEHDYHAEELERIEAQTNADVARIEAEAAAAVAVIEAQGEAAAHVAETLTDTDPPDPDGAGDDPADELIDSATDDNPTSEAPPADTAGELLDLDDDVDAATGVLDALPVIDTDPTDDRPPRPSHWYKRRLWGGDR